MLSGDEMKIQCTPTMGCYLDILVRIKEQLDCMLTYHNKVFVLRFDFRVREYSDDNALMSSYMKMLIKRSKRHYKLKRVGYVWARETAKSDVQHYHCAIMLDGSKVWVAARVLKFIDEIAERWDLPRPYTPKNCYYNLRRNERESYERCFYRLSYLAKTSTKVARPKATNDYSTSRLKPKPLTGPGSLPIAAS